MRIHFVNAARVAVDHAARASERVRWKERIMYFLTTGLEYPEAVARDIHESRLDLAHARSDLGEDDLRRYREHADLVAAAVRAGIASVLSVSLPAIPERLPFDLPTALKDVEYVEGEEMQRPTDCTS